MNDAYSWQSDSRPRPEVRISVRHGEREIDVSVDEPTEGNVRDGIAAFERLAGVLIMRGESL
jgi:hypothetical protein